MKHSFEYYSHMSDKRCRYCGLFEMYYINEIENLIFDNFHNTEDLNKTIEEKLPCLTNEEYIIKQII